MSFLKSLPFKGLPLVRARVFSTSPFVSKSVVEGTKEALEAANRNAGKAAAQGIDKARMSIEIFF